MNVKKINLNNQTNFKGLYVSPKTIAETHFTEKTILSNPVIKDAAVKYEVLCTKGKKIYKLKKFQLSLGEFSSIISKSFGYGGLFGTLFGGTLALLPENNILYTFFSLPNMGQTITSISAGVISGLLMASGIMYRHTYKKVPELDIKIGQGIEIKDFDIDKATLKGHTSEINISMRKVGRDGDIKTSPQDIEDELVNLQKKEEKDFNEVLSYFDTDDLFDANNYLKLLKKLKEKCPYDKYLFERKIDKMGNTMLTAFFDVPLTNKNEKVYDEILDILSNEPCLDFNHKGYMGVSILEKIMLSENSKALDMVTKKQNLFDYTPELNDIYVNIQNQSFKEKVKNLSFEYKDLTDALLNKSGKSIEKLMPYIEGSELLNRLRIQSQVGFVLENRVNDRNFELYLTKRFPQLIYDTKDGEKWRVREQG